MSQPISRLPGMCDLTGEAIERLERVAKSMGSLLRDHRYELVDTPILEETELFVRKSGGEMTSRLYSFLDPGGIRVSLRPEFTPSVIRHLLQEGKTLSPPRRLRYAGPVFRYEQSERGSYRQFTQLGAELVGVGGVSADAEVIRLSVETLRSVGLDEPRLRIGHLGALQGVLEHFGLSESARLFILSYVHRIKEGRTDAATLIDRASGLGILRGGADVLSKAALSEMTGDRTGEFVKDVLRESLSAPIGRRTTEQIVARLLRRVGDADDPDNFAAALDVIRGLVSLDGPPGAVVDEARRVASSHGVGGEQFEELEQLMGKIDGRGVTLDLGHARGIAYYTGVVFDLSHAEESGGERLLGGGGRYDGLVRVLGGDESVPAAGFACTLEQVVACLDAASPAVQMSAAS